MPEVAVDLRRFAKGHADARGAEEGVCGAVVFAEVEVYVGACVTKGGGWFMLVCLFMRTFERERERKKSRVARSECEMRGWGIEERKRG